MTDERLIPATMAAERLYDEAERAARVLDGIKGLESDMEDRVSEWYMERVCDEALKDLNRVAEAIEEQIGWDAYEVLEAGHEAARWAADVAYGARGGVRVAERIEALERDIEVLGARYHRNLDKGRHGVDADRSDEAVILAGAVQSAYFARKRTLTAIRKGYDQAMAELAAAAHTCYPDLVEAAIKGYPACTEPNCPNRTNRTEA